MDLIQQLAANRGASEVQAKGGAGMLCGLAHHRLDGGDFAEIIDKVSGVDDMLSAAAAAADGLDRRSSDGGMTVYFSTR